MEKKPEFIFKDLGSRTGGGEATKVQLVVNTNTGEANLELTYEVYESYPVTDYDKVMGIYEKLGKSGRKWLNIEKILKAMWN